MIQFAQPIWLYAISGIAVPIAIHLWNVRQGKTLRVGSISLVEQSSRQTSRNLKLTELLLLALRCLLVIFLSVLLAKPLWHPGNTTNEKKWLLIDKNYLQQAHRERQPLIDSFIAAGYEFHYFNNGLSRESFSSALKEGQDTALVDKRNYWQLLEELDNKLPLNGSAFIIAPALVKYFPGQRPNLSHEIKWLQLNNIKAEMYSLVDAWRSTDDSVQIVSASGNDSALTYHQATATIGSALPNGAVVRKNNGGVQVAYKGQQIIADTSVITFTIFADKNSSDGKYVLAALQAIESFSKRNMQVAIVDNISRVPGHQQWLFWLSDKPVPSTTIFTNLFKYASGKQASVHSWVESENFSVTGEIGLRKRILFDQPDSQAVSIWKDGFGIPLLVESFSNDKNIYSFYSRFNAAWNDLGWSSYFPSLLMDLVVKKNVIDARNNAVDNRRMDPSLLQFTPTQNNGRKYSSVAVYEDLSAAAWIIVCLLFLLERWVSLRTKKAIVE